MLGFGTFEFDSDFFAGNDIGTEVYVAEGSRANFPADAIFVTDSKVLFESNVRS